MLSWAKPPGIWSLCPEHCVTSFVCLFLLDFFIVVVCVYVFVVFVFVLFLFQIFNFFIGLLLLFCFVNKSKNVYLSSI